MHTIDDVRPVHRTAVAASVELVAGVSVADLRRPTPCADWDLGQLVTHMTVQHRGFAAAARGHGADLAVWNPATVADAVSADPGRAYGAAASDVLDAFAADGVLEAVFDMPEFGPGATVPGAMAIGFHFVDYVVHGWDVARSIGVPFELPADVLAAVVPLALAVPDTEVRDSPESPFAHALPAVSGTDGLDTVLRHLGRDPDWRPGDVNGGR